jgi:glutathione S-transferase
VLNELGLTFQSERVDPKNKKVSEGDYIAMVNPKGNVPALKLDNGQVLTETGVIIQYLADQKPEAGLVPKLGTWERYQLMEMVNHIATDFHKGIGILFNPSHAPEVREMLVGAMNKRLTYINDILKTRQTLLATGFSVADIYMYVVLSWAQKVKLDLTPFPQVLGLMERVGQRPAVQKTLQAES